MITHTIKESVGTEIYKAANRLIAPPNTPYGYVINRGPVETKTEFYGLYNDKFNPGYYYALIKWLGGCGGVFIRVHGNNVFKY